MITVRQAFFCLIFRYGAIIIIQNADSVRHGYIDFMEDIVRKGAVSQILRIRIDQISVLIGVLPVGRGEDYDADIGIGLLDQADGGVKRSVPGEQIDIVVFIHHRAVVLIIAQIIHDDDHVHGGKIHAF